ncbi:uncharacterized protein [Haliotis cracherodii]|uniref:uncharacterized protein n=1 Tax=Haliotis cracherodii TaxID=6455 RepID=UPI0039EBB9B4
MLFGVKKFHQYLAENHFTIETDHKPLLGLFAETKAIPMMASARIQRWALTLPAYEYELVYRPGSQIANADCLSRLPAKEKPSIQETPVPPEYIMLLELMDTSPVTSKHIRSWTRQDPVLSTVLRYVQWGWPNFCENPEMKSYYCRRDELTVQDGCVLWGNRVVIPPPGRGRVFTTHGLPEMLVSDNGTCFTSEEFKAFMEKNCIHHVQTALYQPSSNGLAERSVRTFKEGIKKLQGPDIQTRLDRFLFLYRTTPQTTTGQTPAELLVNWRLRTHLDLTHPSVQQTVKKSQWRQNIQHDLHVKDRSMKEQDTVYVKNFGN